MSCLKEKMSCQHNDFQSFCLFSGSDPSQHILDTLEQCISVIIEKIQRLDQDRNGSRMSSIDYNKANEGNLQHYITPYYITLHYITSNYITLHYIACI